MTDLLYASTAVHLQRQRDNVPFHLFSKLLLLQLASVFKEFLNHVIAKYVLHELDGVWQDFLKDSVLVVTVRTQEFVLDKARAMLITTELHHMINEALQFQAVLARLLIRPKIVQQSAAHTLWRISVPARSKRRYPSRNVEECIHMHTVARHRHLLPGIWL